jgi:hypothetical protein
MNIRFSGKNSYDRRSHRATFLYTFLRVKGYSFNYRYCTLFSFHCIIMNNDDFADIAHVNRHHIDFQFLYTIFQKGANSRLDGANNAPVKIIS